MKIKIFAQIETQVDERFSRTDNVTIVLDDEALATIADAVFRKLDALKKKEEVDHTALCVFCGLPLGRHVASCDPADYPKRVR